MWGSARQKWDWKGWESTRWGKEMWAGMEPDCCHFQFHSTKATQCRAGSKRTNLSAFSNIQVGHCSCEVPKRKGRKEMDEKDRDEAWENFIGFIGRSPCRGCCMVWPLLFWRRKWCSHFGSRREAAFQAASKLHPNEFGITGPKGYSSCGQAWPILWQRYQAAPKALAKAASKAKAGGWERRKRGPIEAWGSSLLGSLESLAHGD